MRIDAYNQIQQIYGTKKLNKAEEKKTASSSFRDQLILSSTAMDTAIAKQAVADAPDIREDRVIQVRNRMASGNYKVDNGDFAAKLLEKYEAYC